MLTIIVIVTLISCVLLLVILKSVQSSPQQVRPWILQVVSEIRALRERSGDSVYLDVLGREWYGTEWPRQYSKRELDILTGAFTQDGVPRLPNPAPFQVGDGYGLHVLMARFSAADPLNQIKLLEQLRGVSAIPRELVELAANNTNEAVRLWIGSHADCRSLECKGDSATIADKLGHDSSRFVRASLLSNPEYSGLPWSAFGARLEDDWRERLRSYTQEECFALMYNPKLSVRYLLELMQNTPENLGIGFALRSQMVAIGVRNPGLIEDSRRYGRKSKLTLFRDDVIDVDRRYEEIWRLAFGLWWPSEASRAVALYIQTTPETKLEVFKRFQQGADSSDALIRLGIIQGATMPADKELLTLALKDSDVFCLREATRKIEGWNNRCFEYDPDLH